MPKSKNVHIAKSRSKRQAEKRPDIRKRVKPMFSTSNVAAMSVMASAGSALAAAGATGAIMPIALSALAGGVIAYTVTNEIPENGD